MPLPKDDVKKMIVGISSNLGRKRIEIKPTTTASALKTAIKNELQTATNFIIKRDKNGRPGDEIKLTPGANVRDLRISHGETLHVLPLEGTRFEDISMSEPQPSTSSAMMQVEKPVVPSGLGATNVKVIEDPIDQELLKQSGKIVQPRSQNCSHAGKAGCIHCMAKEPYDAKYLEEQGIKFMSFHAYLRKLSDEKGKYGTLEDINLKIKPGCTTHEPWPKSMCSRCRPPALTLNRQVYRHVDHITFENANIVDNFLAFWRETGRQRYGFLYGRYESHPEVPLGIKAVVCAIYEPPQESTRDHIKFIPDDQQSQVDEISDKLGLLKVGWIFTDLVSDGNGEVKCFRSGKTHFMSAQECIISATFQNEHPNKTARSPSGKYGSKFVTVIVTGNAEKQVHMEGYQVSNQCMALVRDKILIPTKDAPELGYIIDSSPSQYVPDVIYKEKDDYGNEVTKNSRPLPVEYLLIDVPVATPVQPMSTFTIKPQGFPIENRPMEGHLQDFAALAHHRQTLNRTDVISFFKDFHLLIYLGTQTVFPLDLTLLLEGLKIEDSLKVYNWMESDSWATLEACLHHQDGYQ